MREVHYLYVINTKSKFNFSLCLAMNINSFRLLHVANPN